MRRRGEPLTLPEVVAELVDRFSDPGDRPSDHRCTAHCTHQMQARLSLLDRVRWLVPASQQTSASDAPRAGRRSGSPAPWSAGPAEFLDEVARGSIEMDRTVRSMLGFGELPVAVPPPQDPPVLGPACRMCGHYSCALVRRSSWSTVPGSRAPAALVAVAALRGMPTLLEFLAERHPSSRKARGALIDPARPRLGYRWGEYETLVRSWHRRALELTGHESPDPIVREMKNPHWRAGWLGPSCADAWLCGHESCRGILFARDSRKWIRPACPFCGGLTLPQDQLTGVIYCDRPRCVDPDTGRRPEWSLAAFRAWGLRVEGLAS